MKKKIIISICVLILLGATIFSLAKFGVWNPFSSCFGMLEILFTDKEYTVVQHFPNKVVLAKPNLLEKYLDNEGLYEIKEKRIGSTHTYTDGEKTEKIHTRLNGYYMIGNWEN